MGLIRTSIFFWALLFVPALLFANGTIETDFPGFDIFEKVSGDLNADGYQDYAATIWKKGDRDAPIVIYFSDSGGRFKLGIKAMSANCHGCGGMKGNPEGPVGNIQIKNGILITTFLGVPETIGLISTNGALIRKMLLRSLEKLLRAKTLLAMIL